VIAGAVKDHQVFSWFAEVRDEMVNHVLQMLFNPITEGDAVGKQARAISALPPEQVGGEFFLVGPGAHENISVHPLKLENLR
jgi:hypothetical protein